MADPEYIPVRYERNADERATGAITFPDDNREDIAIGYTGVLTESEFVTLNANGLVFTVLEGDEAAQVIQDAQTPEPERSLDDLQVTELRDIADEEGVDLSGKTKKEDIVAAIQDARQTTGAESLPATATRAPAPVVAGAGGAAGPGGAGAAPGTSGGGPAT